MTTADLIAGLNLYATKPDAFDEVDETVRALVATHGALAISAARSPPGRRRDRRAADQPRHRRGDRRADDPAQVTREQAFDLLRIASQSTNRKLATSPTEVGDTGTLDLPGQAAAGRRRTAARTPPRRAGAEGAAAPDQNR